MKRALLFGLFLGGCEVTATVGLTPAGQSWTELHMGTARDEVDLLFVIDNSPSMAPKQAELRARFPELLRIIAAGDGGGAGPGFPAGGHPVHYHLGVITSDLGAGPFTLGQGQCHPGGDGGRLQALGNSAPVECQPPLGLPYIDLDQRAGTDNLPPGQDLNRTFSCMAAVGDRGCGFEQPLEAAYLALHDPVPENQGFLRPDAVLAVVFLTDEDDCSAPPDSDLFDPTNSAYGALLSFRCTQYGIRCAGAAPPYGDSGGPLPACEAAPNPDGMGPGKLYDVQRYRDLFATLKPKPDEVIVTTIAAPPDPVATRLVNPNPQPPGPYQDCAGPPDGKSCAVVLEHSCISAVSGTFFGDPAVRLAAAVSGSDLPGLGQSICDTNYLPALQSLGHTLAAVQTGQGCIQAPLPDPNEPRCIVEDVLVSDGARQTIRVHTCGETGGALPCWSVVETALCATVTYPTGAGRRLQLVVERAPDAPPASTRARCVIATTR